MTKNSWKNRNRKKNSSCQNHDKKDVNKSRAHKYDVFSVRMCFDVPKKIVIFVLFLPCKIASKIMSILDCVLDFFKRFFQNYGHRYQKVHAGDAENPQIEFDNRREPNRDKKLIELEIRLKEYEGTINKLTKDNEDAELRFQDRINMIRREKEDAISRLSTENKLTVDVLKREKDDALSRLSELMGAKLRDNNPAITNLNDPNRPMKLGDQFSELYENEWTDSYTALLDNKELNLTEEQAITVLLNIVHEIYKVCLQDVAEQLSGQRRVVNGFSDDEIESFMKAVKDSVKSQANLYVPLLCKKLTSDTTSCSTIAEYKSYSLEYIENCVKICYFAVVQDPPMYIDFAPDNVLDKQVYKEYTKSGNAFDYLVWPALYLHKGGPILCKGVFQPK